MKQSNDMWKLDLLETKFRSCQPRFPHTKKLLAAKHNSKLLKKLPVTRDEADQQILALKSDFFGRKYYAAVKKLEKEITKLIKAGKTASPEFIKDQKNVDNMITSKIVKSIQSSVLTTKELKQTPPKYISKEVYEILTDKSNPCNPSKFFIDNCQNNKQLNNYISNLWNNKGVKVIVSDIEWSFKIVRGDITKQERDARKAQTGKDEIEEVGDENENDSDSESDSGSESDDAAEYDIQNVDFDEDKYAMYDQSNESGEEEFAADPNVNYNEITDEEPSEDEDEDEIDEDEESEEDEFFDAPAPKKDDKKSKKEKEKKEKSLNLPELATGYFSGGESDSDDFDPDADKVVKAATTTRKNRRGQRARQKIWEQKYGKEAKHVKLERERYMNEREQKQKEFEERQRKREEKARNAPSGSNVEPIGQRVVRESTPTSSNSTPAPAPVSEKVHPSWEAKRLAEEKQKNVKFAGKKITFD